jgi:hypothetical protein
MLHLLQVHAGQLSVCPLQLGHSTDQVGIRKDQRETSTVARQGGPSLASGGH